MAEQRGRRWLVSAVAACLTLTSCSSASEPPDLNAATTQPDPDVSRPASTTAPEATDVGASTASTTVPAAATGSTAVTVAPAGGSDAAPEGDDGAAIDVTGRAVPIDPRVFGVNVPAWLGPERLADPDFVAETLGTGATLVRMPGGSWSNAYRWSACEQRDDTRCFWPWAARPSDFVGYLAATGLDGMWTVSINETAQSAAAAVAFFNADVGDDRVIGVDRNGVDWGTVGRWAALRAEGGHAEPAGIRLWEVGNEVYGGRPESGGDQCAPFGWEDVWTCDGREYVNGIDGYDGFLAIRAAMIEVDPSIAVGAVGVGEPSAWSSWGDEVIGESGDALDFYVVHAYGFDGSPSGDEAVRRPVDLWPSLVDAATAPLAGTPLAITEYNLVSFEAGDTERTMTTTMNGLYLADSLGQLVANDVPIAAMWNLANGTTSSGTDYGLISVDGGGRLPAYEAFRWWSGAGSHRLDPVVTDELRIYPTLDDDGRLALIVVNIGEAAPLDARLMGLDGPRTGTLSGVTAESLVADAFDQYGPIAVTVEPDAPFGIEVPARSISLLELP